MLHDLLLCLDSVFAVSPFVSTVPVSQLKILDIIAAALEVDKY